VMTEGDGAGVAMATRDGDAGGGGGRAVVMKKRRW
jgi:hypothetical protein